MGDAREGVVGAHLVEVQAGREVVALRVDNRSAKTGIEAREGSLEAAQRFVVDRISLLHPIQCQDQHGALGAGTNRRRQVGR